MGRSDGRQEGWLALVHSCRYLGREGGREGGMREC